MVAFHSKRERVPCFEKPQQVDYLFKYLDIPIGCAQNVLRPQRGKEDRTRAESIRIRALQYLTVPAASFGPKRSAVLFIVDGGRDALADCARALV